MLAATMLLQPFVAAGYTAPYAQSAARGAHGRLLPMHASSSRCASPRSGRALCCATDDDEAFAIRPASACWVQEQSREMLQRFGSAFEAVDEKVYAYENLLLSRSQAALLDAALLEVASMSSSRLARRRYPFRLPSKRATIGCYGRLLAEMDGGRLQIELGSESERPADGPESGRRKLLQLLRWCAYGREGKGGGVWRLEGEVLAQTGLRRIGEAYGRADAQ